MRSFARLPIALVLLATAQPAGAQPPPSLAGTWTLVPERAATADPPARIPATAGSGWGQTLTITQDDKALTIERAQFSAYDMQAAPRFVYALDGSESRNVVNMGRGPQVHTARVTWKAGALTITARYDPDSPLASEVTYVLSLEPSGELVIETTRGDGPAATTRSRYRRN